MRRKKIEILRNLQKGLINAAEAKRQLAEVIPKHQFIAFEEEDGSFTIPVDLEYFNSETMTVEETDLGKVCRVKNKAALQSYVNQKRKTSRVSYIIMKE